MDVVVRKKPLLGFARTYRDIFLVCSIMSWTVDTPWTPWNANPL